MRHICLDLTQIMVNVIISPSYTSIVQNMLKLGNSYNRIIYNCNTGNTYQRIISKYASSGAFQESRGRREFRAGERVL